MRIATFNLNNLFSRYNFSADIDTLPNGFGEASVGMMTRLDPAGASGAKFRTFAGRLVKGKPPVKRAQLAQRIAAIDPDVLAVQEVEDVTTLTAFANEELAELDYRYVVLVEGNDPRLIDVGLLSRYPIGQVTSWRHAVAQPTYTQPVFGRDLLQVDILTQDHSRRLLTIFNTHLKSNFCPRGQNPAAYRQQVLRIRAKQAATAARIVAGQTQPDSPYLVCGDMNDSPTSPALEPLVKDKTLNLVDGLAHAVADRPAPPCKTPAPDRPWSYVFESDHEPADYQLFDQIWLSPALAQSLTTAGIGRRIHLKGDASDHDPTWVDLAL